MRLRPMLAYVAAAMALTIACTGTSEDGGPGPSVTYTLSGTVSGLTGAGLVLTNNGGSDLAVASGATTFAFPGAVNAGASYNIAVKSQPGGPTQNCVVSNGTGTANSNVVVTITCTTSSFAVGGSIAGLVGGGLTLILNGGTPVGFAAGSTTFTFPPLESGTGYTVTVGTQPSGPVQACAITSGTGTVGSAPVTTIAVVCTPNATVGGTITGLAGAGLALRLNGGPPLVLAAGATTFTFPLVFNAGSAYGVTISAQPAGPVQSCTIIRGKGQVQAGSVTNIAVQCLSNTTSPLSGTYSITLDDKPSFLTFWPDGTYSTAIRSDDAGCNNNGNGVEYGVYNWNATTGAVVIRSAAIDITGDCGVWDPTVGAGEGFQGTLTKAGNTLSLTPLGQVVTLTLTLVPSTPSTLLGAFSGAGGSDGSFVVFLGDGTYLFADTQPSVAAVGLVGYERACYTSTAVSVTATFGAGCTPNGFPLVDGNGVSGFSSTPGQPVALSITGANTITLAGRQLVRILPN